jgi:DNA-binding transcriptional LysR family regulator
VGYDRRVSQDLDIAALRSFVGVADCGGFHRAAAALHLTQSAVSQHVRKLERVIGKPLVARDGRRARFTEAGEALLGEGRTLLTLHDEVVRGLAEPERPTLVVGSTEHAADQLLPELGSALRDAFPDSDVRFRLDRTARLAEAVDRAEVDIAVLIGGGTGGRSRAAGTLPLAWFAAPSWTPPPPGGEVPLVVFEEPCVVRRTALDLLAGSGVRVTLAAQCADLSGVESATRAGIGLTLLPDVGRRPEGLVELPQQQPLRGGDLVLPALSPAPLRVRVRRGAPEGLAAAAADAVRAALGRPDEPRHQPVLRAI